MKPRSDSKLKCLPRERQEQIAEWIATPKSETCPGGLQHAREQLAADGLAVSLRALSEFWAWWQLQERFAGAEERTQQILDLVRQRNPDWSPEKIRETGNALFAMQAIEQSDPDMFIGIESLRLRRESAEAKARFEVRKLELAERRVRLLEEKQAAAREKLEAVVAKGGLSAETLRQIEEAARLL